LVPPPHWWSAHCYLKQWCGPSWLGDAAHANKVSAKDATPVGDIAPTGDAASMDDAAHTDEVPTATWNSDMAPTGDVAAIGDTAHTDKDAQSPLCSFVGQIAHSCKGRG
jgi:hypothetical protein